MLVGERDQKFSDSSLLSQSKLVLPKLCTLV